MLSSLHEILVELLRCSPSLLRDCLGDRLPALDADGLCFDTDHTRGSNLIEVGKDLVLKVSDRTGKLLCALVVEVQLERDESKTRTWALYAAWAHYRLRCPVHVVVLALDDSVARWAAGPFCIGDMTLRPWVIGPEHIEPITSVAQANQSVELAFLSGMVHRNSPVAVDVGRALWRALVSKKHEQGDLMWDIFMTSIDVDARRALEMELGEWLPQSDWGRKIYEEGQQQGEAKGLRKGEARGLRKGEARGLRKGEARGLRKGKVEGEASALLLLLHTRRIRLTQAQRRRIQSCRELGQVRAWLRRAATATTAAQVLDDT